MINDNRMLVYMAPITVIGPAVALSSLVVSLVVTEGLARLLRTAKGNYKTDKYFNKKNKSELF